MGSYKFPDTLADRTGSQICHCEGVTFSPEVPNYPAKYCEIPTSLRSSE